MILRKRGFDVMKKKLIAIVCGVSLILSASSCGVFNDALDSYKDKAENAKDSLTATSDATVDTSADTTPDVEEFSPEFKSGDIVSSVKLSLDSDSGKLNIDRAEKQNVTPMGEDGTWTVFVYICGTDLESDPEYGGAATEDIMEMCAADENENVRFVFQTGGTLEWNNTVVDYSKTQRYVVVDGGIELVYEDAIENMGESETLADFLNWGVENYPAENMGVVFWNHGGGSISGVCFDELYDYDSLTLYEIDSALLSVYNNMTDKFEFIGFDACLMSTLEAANVLATYADYMYASEEYEPGYGWDYTTIGDYLADNPDCNGEQLGKIVTDSYFSMCLEVGEENSATFSVTDLSKIDELIVTFNDFAKELYEESVESASYFAEVMRNIKGADDFGGNNDQEGYSNMVDLGGIASACGDKAVLEAIDEAVVYKKNGSDHLDATGLSVYYPLYFDGGSDLAEFNLICPSPYYVAFIKLVVYNASFGGDLSDFTVSDIIDDGSWTNDSAYILDDSGYFSEVDASYYEGTNGQTEWDFAEGIEVTGMSPYITFEIEPSINDNGLYCFQLDEYGIENLYDACAFVYTYSEDGLDYIDLGETYDVYIDFESGYCEDLFDGYWLSLPDGQNLALYISLVTYDYIVYNAPVMVNNEYTYLRILQSFEDGSAYIEGICSGIDENGMASRDSVSLELGDVIIPVYDGYSIEGDDMYVYYGEEYTYVGDDAIEYLRLDAGDYLYAFCIDDVFGDYYVTDYIEFCVDENGDTYYYTY